MIRSMSNKEIKKYILELEQRYPVNQWQIQGVDVWPHIRIKLYFLLLNLDTDKPEINNSYSAKNKKHLAIRRLIKIPGAIMKALFGLHQFYKKLKPKKILFFGSHFHRTRHEGVYFNRFFDPMIEEYQLQDEVYIIEFEKLFDKNFNQKAILPLHQYLDQYKLLNKLNELFSQPVKENIELKDYKAFYEELSNDFPGAKNLNISIQALTRWARKINHTKGFFSRLFKKTKPEKIIFLSYYGYDDLAAALLAAHELGVKTIDFQHGPQTNVHMAYTAWNKHPDRPYNIMPLEYWTWDQRSRDNIEEWARKTGFIEVKNVGHPYLAYFKKKKLFRQKDEKMFFSLQTLSLEEMLPGALLNLIRESGLKWNLRMHPRSNFTQEELKFFLNRNKIHKDIYEIQDAINTPLPEALSGAKLHITNFSGCVLEAGMLNIPSLIIHESGKEIFRAYIDDNSVYYLNPDEAGFKESFFNIIKKLPEKNIEREIREVPKPLE
ncbi:hypothetical protein LY54_00325 [Salegentibacter mishustinae]|nr:hypothetical protein LY54_00325 [Salegentibacter mishustinae]GGW78727.1 hypothetical protein GCM10008086_02900 [Salegentibacter mishustinae]